MAGLTNTVVACQIVEQGAAHRVWQKIVRSTDTQGHSFLTTNRAVVELATGLNYRDPASGSHRQHHAMIACFRATAPCSARISPIQSKPQLLRKHMELCSPRLTHRQGGKVGCGNPMMGWLLLLLSVMFALTSSGQTNSPDFEAFKEQLAQPVQRFEMEFEEGNVTGKPTISMEKMNSKHGQIEIVYQSVRSYSASCQSNAFLLLQKVQEIVLGTNRDGKVIQGSLSFGCGYYEKQAWYRGDRFNVNLETWDPANIHSNNYLWQISNWNNKVWSIYYYGLPQLEPTTIHWDGTQLTAVTASGETLQAYVQISKTDGTVESLTYSTEGRQGRESAFVFIVIRLNHVENQLVT